MRSASTRGDTPRPVSAAAKRERIAWLDCAKGIGIILVVIGHAGGGLIDSRTASPSVVLQSLFFVIYTFHMPLFFFLSAVLMRGRVERNSGDVWRSLGRRIVYPYFLWSILQFSIIYLAGSLVNNPADDYMATILSLPWRPLSQFWFLYVLAFLQISALLLLPLGGRWLFLAAMLLFWAGGVVAGLHGLPEQIAHNALFYGLGVAIGPALGGLIARLRGWPTPIVLIGFMVFVALVVWIELGSILAGPRIPAAAIADKAWGPDALGAALLGGLATLLVASKATGRSARWLAFVGRASMAIFLVHVILIAGSRILIGRLVGPVDPLAMLLVLSAIGLFGALIAQWVALRLGIARLLALD